MVYTIGKKEGVNIKKYKYACLIRQSNDRYEYFIPCVDLFGVYDDYNEVIKEAREALILELAENYIDSFPEDVISDELKKEDDIEMIIEFNEFDINKRKPNNTPYKFENFNFIWGVRDVDEPDKHSTVNYYTMNDIELSYDDEKYEYDLSVETVYGFEDVKYEKDYLEKCLKCFEKFMDDNEYEKRTPSIAWRQLELSMSSETIEELYVNFKMYVKGFVNYNEED